MNDLRHLLSRPVTITFRGRTVRACPLDLDENGDLQDWIDSLQPDPFDVAYGQIARGIPVLDDRGHPVKDEDGKPRRVPYSIDQQKFLISQAMKLKTQGQILLGSAEADAILNTPAGKRKLIEMSLRKADPDLPDDWIDGFFAAATHATKEKILATADPVRAVDPKSPTDGTTTPEDTGPSPSTGGRSSGN